MGMLSKFGTEQSRHMQRSVQTYIRVPNAERNKRYYDLGLRPAEFSVGQWVLYFNARKLRGKPMK